MNPEIQHLSEQITDDLWKSLGPDELSRWLNAITVGSLPLSFTPLAPLQDVIDLGVAGIHGTRAALENDPTLKQAHKAEAMGSLVAAIPGPVGAAARLSRFTKPASKIIRGPLGQAGAFAASTKTASSMYPDELVGKTPSMDILSKFEKGDTQQDMTAGEATSELDRILKKNLDINLGDIYYTRDVDTTPLAQFRRKRPLSAGFDHTTNNLMSLLNEAAPAAVQQELLKKYKKSKGLTDRRKKAAQEAGADVGDDAGGILSAIKKYSPATILTGLAAAASAPWVYKSLFGEDEVSPKGGQSLVPRAGETGKDTHATLIDKLTGSLGLMQGFNPATATITALLRRMGHV